MAKTTQRKPQPKTECKNIQFFATLPDILSAVSLSGVRDSGARIKLDIPASDVGAAVLLQQLGAGRLLKISIEIVEGKAGGSALDEVDEIIAGLDNV